MSNTDSFIDEVTEEVQKDKLYGYLKRYGWIGIAGVVLLVGGAAFNEWNKAKSTALAEANGDALTLALSEADGQIRAEMITAAPIEGDAIVIKAMLEAGELFSLGNAEAAVAVLAPFTTDAILDPIYRDLAVLKTAMIGAQIIPAEERIAMLAGIASFGSPYRLFAEEQIAAAQVEMGELEVAIDGLRAISEDAAASSALRQRALQMIVAIGGDPLEENG